MRVFADSRRGIRAVALGLALLVTAPSLARAGEAIVLGHASAANLKGLLTKVGQLVEKFAPGQGQQVEGVGAMLTQNPEFVGVDWTKPANAILLGGKAFGKTEPVPVVLVALADAAPFRQAHPDGGPVAFEIRDNIAIIAQEKAALAAITPERFALYSKFPKIAGEGDVYVTAYLNAIIAEYKAEIDEGLKQLELGAGQPQMAGPMASIGKIVKCFAPLLDLAGQQVHRVTLVVQFNPDAVEAFGRVYAAEDSVLGTFLSGQPAETTDLAKYLPPEAVVTVAAKVDIIKAKPLFDAILKAVATPLDLTTEDVDTIRALMFASTSTGEFAVALPSGAGHQGMEIAQVTRITDGAKFRAASKAGVEWFAKSGLGTAMTQGMGMKIALDHKPNAREHQGVAIDRMTVTFTPADPNAPPNPMMPQQPPQTTEFAAVDTLALAATNNAKGDLLDGIIDRVKGGGTPGFDSTATSKAIRAAAPKAANLMAHLSFNSFLAKVVEEMAKAQPAIAMMAGAVIKADPTEEPITTYATFGANMAEWRTRIPHQPILAMVTRVRAMIDQGGPGGRKPGPKPKEQDDF